MKYETVIGLEVHAQLRTLSKMFCGCSTRFGAEPNTQTCPVCLGLPGALPVVNKKAVEFGVRMALAVDCHLNKRSLFARKNYFYPDLPKGYQVSQYEAPLAENGWIEIDQDGSRRKRIGIRRIHLEEDAGKSVHSEAYVAKDESLVDFNRCGVPLLEIVSEPEIHSPAQARQYLVNLRQMLKWLDICDGNMEEASLRCDANISIRPAGNLDLGVKTELKNLNSFRAVERALQYEIHRQTERLKRDEEIIQETLFWDESKNIAYPIRSKEESQDYRYFPDPDLEPLKIGQDWIEEIRISLPELPDERKQRWQKEWGLSNENANILLEEKTIADYFDVVAEGVDDVRQAANWIIGEGLRVLKEDGIGIHDLRIRPHHLVEIIHMIEKGVISYTSAKRIFDEAARTGMHPSDIVEKRGISQISDRCKIESIVEHIIQEHPREVKKFLGGREGVLGFFIGLVMKATEGRANPKVASDVLRKMLEQKRVPKV